MSDEIADAAGSDASSDGFELLCGLADDDFDDIEDNEEIVQPPAPPTQHKAARAPALDAAPSSAKSGSSGGGSSSEARDIIDKAPAATTCIRKLVVRGKSIKLKCDWGVGIGGNLWT